MRGEAVCVRRGDLPGAPRSSKVSSRTSRHSLHPNEGGEHTVDKSLSLRFRCTDAHTLPNLPESPPKSQGPLPWMPKSHSDLVPV